MKCPCCLKDLSITHQERYQDLSEHVSNPNGVPSLKDGYQCLNEYCIANNLNCTWIEDGGIYIDPPEGVKWTVAHQAIEKSSVSGMYYALDSWEHYYNLGKRKIEKRSLLINLYQWKIKIYPKERGWDFPLEKRYEPSLFKYKVEFWRREKSGGYILIIPLLRMVNFCIKEFNRDFTHWRETGNINSAKKALEGSLGLDYSGKKDERLYKKISSLFIATVYPKKVSILIGEVHNKKSK